MNLDSISLFRFLLAALTCFRLAQLITMDKGPFLVFERLRQRVEQHTAIRQGFFWRSLADGVSCPYCMGLYVGIFCTILVLFPSWLGDLFLLLFGLVGLQAFLQGVSNRE